MPRHFYKAYKNNYYKTKHYSETSAGKFEKKVEKNIFKILSLFRKKK